jgi:hypothetical protein
MRSHYLKHLKQQIGFLIRSCEMFDAGHRDEAIRIAVVLRVILRDTGSSKSLLNHLGALDILLLSTAPDYDSDFAALGPKDRIMIYSGLHSIKIHPGVEISLDPSLENSFFNDHLTVPRWLNQVVYSTTKKLRITRETLMLGAANKDGGAHVDLNVSEEYQAASRENEMSHLWKHSGKPVPVSDEPIYLVSLRQMAYEILHSPDIQALCAEF